MGNWDRIPLGSVIKIDKNSVLPTDFAQDVYYVGLEDIEKETGRILSTIKIASDAGLKSNKFEFTDQHILYGKLRPNLNKVALPDFNGVCSTDIYPILPITSRIDRRFLCAILRSTLFVDYVSNKVNGVNLPRVNEKIISDFRIPLPSLPIQQKIADALDKASALIEMRKAQIEKLDLLIKSQFIEMFGTIYRTSFLTKTLDEITDLITDGTHQTPTYITDSIKGYKFLSSKDVITKKIDWSKVKYIPEALHQELYSHISPRKGDILLAKNGTTGVAAIVDTEDVFDIYVSLALLRFVPGYDIYYLWAAVNSDDTKNQFNSSLKGVGVPNLHLGEIKKARIIVPPLSLQIQYADIVQKIEFQKVLISQSLSKLQQEYDSVMQKYFSGEMF